MTSALKTPIAAPTRDAKTRIDLDRCAAVTAKAADLAYCRSDLEAHPGAPVVLDIIFDDAAYGVLKVWQMRDVEREGQRFVAMDGQIIEMGSEGYTFPMTVQETCTLLLPAITLTKDASLDCYLSTLPSTI